jgi:hypothetical protein
MAAAVFIRNKILVDFLFKIDRILFEDSADPLTDIVLVFHR